MEIMLGLFKDSSKVQETIAQLSIHGIHAEGISLFATGKAATDIATNAAQLSASLIDDSTGSLRGYTVKVPTIGPVTVCGELVFALQERPAASLFTRLTTELQVMGVPAGKAQDYGTAISEGGMLALVRAPEREAELVLDVLQKGGVVMSSRHPGNPTTPYPLPGNPINQGNPGNPSNPSSPINPVTPYPSSDQGPKIGR
jgi:hypothetical protein